jgi:hypothetical protein
MSRRRVFAAGLASALVLSVGLFAQTDKKAEEAAKKSEEALKKDELALTKLSDAALDAKVGANDLNVTWVHEDFLKTADNKEFVPFTITLDPTKASTEKVTLYWRVVPTPTAAAAPAKKEKDAKPTWLGATLVNVAGAKNPLRLNRSFASPSGSYDVYIVVKEVPADKPPKDFTPKMVVLKHTVNVPDFWNGELNTSTVILVDRIDPLTEPLTPAELVERPYAALGAMELVPAASTKFAKQAGLSVFFQIYNPKPDDAQKPDVSIEYTFCQIVPGNKPEGDDPCKPGEKLFNKTPAQAMNAKTLPAAFNMSLGHLLQTGQAVPLKAFPEGDYRLEIKVTDKLANKSLIRDVNFSVAAS